MARNAQGRFLPGFDADRHFLTKRDRQNGYARAVLLGKKPSRLRAWLRHSRSRCRLAALHTDTSPHMAGDEDMTRPERARRKKDVSDDDCGT